MKISKIIQASLLAGAMLLNTGCVVSADAKEVSVEIDGQPVDFDVPAQIIDGRTMVPMRKIFEELGALVKWDDETKTVSAKKSSKAVSLTINSEDMVIDRGKKDNEGNEITENVALDVPAQIIDGRTLVPVRALSEAFDLDVTWDEDSSKVIITTKNTTDDSWKENVGAIHLDDLTYTGDGISIDGNKITITKGGDFTVSGKGEGSIRVNCDEKVKLRLSNANMTADGEPCIFFENAEKAFITIDSDTENTLVASNCDNGAIYSKDNLEIKGGGTLSIRSDSGHGIKASDNLTIEEGTIDIIAAKDGINVNDTFKMTGGDINIQSVCDGLSSESIVIIEGGNLNIKTTAEPTNVSELNNLTVTDEPGEAMQGHGGFMQEAADAEFESSAKGLKGEWMMVISGGNITVNSTDHAIHCGDEIEISGGALSLNSQYGKGISGHGNVTVDGADTSVNITKSTEGIESKKVLTVNNGSISAVSSDDTLNGTGGKSGDNPAPQNNGEKFTPPEMTEDDRMQPPENFNQNMKPSEKDREDKGNMPPQRSEDFEGKGGMAKANEKDTIIINGGNLELCSTGDDAIDANGNIVINGGVIKATLSGGGIVSFTGVLDADGSVTIGENVTLITATRSGGTPTLSSTQNGIIIYAKSEHGAEDTVSLKSAEGEILEEYTPMGNFQTVFVVSPKLEEGKTYTISIGDEVYDVTMSGGIVSVGDAQTGMGGFGGGMPGGRGNRTPKTTEENK